MNLSNNYNPLRRFRELFLSITLSASLSIAPVLSGCSPSGVASEEGLWGAGLGAVTGAVAGGYIGNQMEYMVLDSAILGGIVGVGLGVIAGAMLHDDRQYAMNKAKPVIYKRMPSYDGAETQREIDTLRQELEDETTWGRAETKPWNDRYRGEDANLPYDGPSLNPGSLAY